MTMTAEQVRTLALDYFDALARLDIEKCMTFFAEDAVWEDQGIEHEFRGIDAVRKSWVDFFDAIADYSYERTAFVCDENGYAFSWTMRCTIQQSFGDFEANGQPLVLKGSSIGTVSDGKITWNCDYWNMASVTRQVQEADAQGSGA